MSVDGTERTHRLHRPPGLSGPAPLVVMLHGGFGSGRQAEGAYGCDAEADAGHFLVAYPDGVNRAWNTGGGCRGQPGRTGVDDVGFLTRVVEDIGRTVPVDPARVYATGISNGGIMAYTAGAGHQWPGAAGTRMDGRISGIDPPSPALDATHRIWQFFAAHPAAP